MVDWRNVKYKISVNFITNVQVVCMYLVEATYDFAVRITSIDKSDPHESSSRCLL